MAQPAKKIWTKIDREEKFTGKPSLVLQAVDKLVDFVKPTLGPKIRHVLVNSGYKTELMDDGVSIAQEFELDDEFEDAVASYVREASRVTDDRAGDGTTTTMVILQRLMHELVASGKTYPVVRKELELAETEAKDQLASVSTEVKSEDELFKVAKTAMDDEVAAKVVAEVVWKTGTHGAVTITDYTGRGMEYEKVEGFVFNRGFLARGMINNKDKQIYEAPNKNFGGQVAIAVVEQLIATQNDIVPILMAAEKAGVKNLAIFCPNIIGEALGIIALNQMKGVFNIVGVGLPGQGDKTKDFVGDLCTVTGASTAVGEFNESNFGYADRVESTSEDTSIIGGRGDKAEIEAKVELLKSKAADEKEDYDREYYHQRQARLQQGIVIIKVGGTTETEIRLRLKKVEDAVNACKCALEEGIVPGAGMTLKKLKLSSAALTEALGAVYETVLSNAELVEPSVEIGDSQTLNVLTQKVGNFIEIGVVDATKVLRVAVENACSIAKILFSISGIITNAAQKPQDNKAG